MEAVSSIQLETEWSIRPAKGPPARTVCRYWLEGTRLRGIDRYYSAERVNDETRFPKEPHLIKDELLDGTTWNRLFTSRSRGGKEDIQANLRSPDPKEFVGGVGHPWVFSGYIVSASPLTWLTDALEGPDPPEIDRVVVQQRELFRVRFAVASTNIEVDVDPTFNFLPVRSEHHWRGAGHPDRINTYLHEKAREVVPGIFVPMLKRTRSVDVDEAGNETEVFVSEGRVTKIEINQPIDPSIFVRTYPQGARVIDQRTNEVVVWGKDGPLGEPVPIESSIDPRPWPLLAWVLGGFAALFVAAGVFLLMRRSTA